MDKLDELKAKVATRLSRFDRNGDGKIDKLDAIAIAQQAVEEAEAATRKKPWGAIAIAFALGVVLTLFVVSGR